MTWTNCESLSSHSCDIQVAYKNPMSEHSWMVIHMKGSIRMLTCLLGPSLWCSSVAGMCVLPGHRVDTISWKLGCAMYIECVLVWAGNFKFLSHLACSQAFKCLIHLHINKKKIKQLSNQCNLLMACRSTTYTESICSWVVRWTIDRHTSNGRAWLPVTMAHTPVYLSLAN